MARERGLGMLETLVVLALAGVLITAGAAYAIPQLAREELRDAAYALQANLQLTRVQAVARNRACCFVLDAPNRSLGIYDLNDPLDGSDDLLLGQVRLPDQMSFARPDSGDPITLQVVSDGVWQAVFAADGSVSAGAGHIAVRADERYQRIVLHAAGGVRGETWDGSAWKAGW